MDGMGKDREGRRGRSRLAETWAGRRGCETGLRAQLRKSCAQWCQASLGWPPRCRMHVGGRRLYCRSWGLRLGSGKRAPLTAVQTLGGPPAGSGMDEGLPAPRLRENARDQTPGTLHGCQLSHCVMLSSPWRTSPWSPPQTYCLNTRSRCLISDFC